MEEWLAYTAAISIVPLSVMLLEHLPLGGRQEHLPLTRERSG